MATLEQLSAALMKANAAGNAADAKVFADEIRKMRSATPAKVAAQPQQEFGTDVPAWGRENPTLYGIAGAAREALGTPLEGLASVAGGLIGAPGGPVGSVMGAGLGYGMGKGVTRLADEVLGNTAPVSAGQGLTRAAGDVATGATMEGAGQIMAPAIAKSVGWLGDRLAGPTMAQLRAAKIARDVAGAKLPEIRQAVSQARPGITAAQAIEEAGINSPPTQALGNMAARNASTWYSDLAQQQAAARAASIKGVAPDAELATGARQVISDMNYGNAYAADAQRVATLNQQAAQNAALGGAGGVVPVVRVSPELQALKGNPVIDAAASAAKARAPGTGDPMETLQGLHTMKLAIDAQMKNPTLPTSLQSMDKAALVSAKARLVDAIEKMSPSYKTGRLDYEAMSKPIDQSNILNNLSSILEKPGGGERATPFLNALGRGEDAAIKGAGVNPAYGGLEEKLLPHQMSTVTKAADEIARDMSMVKSSTAGSTELAKILDQDTLSLRKMIPNMLNRTVSGVTKSLDLAEASLGKKTTAALTDAMKSGQSLQELFNTIPMTERNKILKALINNDPSLKARLIRTLPVVGSVNALSSSENQNALSSP